MDNYFVSIENNKKKYVFPEIIVLSNNTTRDNLVLHTNNNNPTNIDAFRLTWKFNPYTIRISTPIALEAFVFGPTDVFYKVIEGYYMVEDGTLKLKVKKKYGGELLQ